MNQTAIQTDYDKQLKSKKARLNRLLSNYFSGEIECFASTPSHYRMRAEFRIWHEGIDTFHIMFDQTTKEKYRVDQLPSASLIINQAMTKTIEFVKAHQHLRSKLFQIDYLSSTTNEIVISMLYHKKLDDQWFADAQELKTWLSELGLVNIIGRAKKQKVVINNDYVTETLNIDGRDYHFKQIENSFTQPNAQINIKMIEWVKEKSANIQHDLLELYCGAGNFSVPLSDYFKNVLATEISKTSVQAAQVNIERNGSNNLKIARLSSEEFVQAFNKEREFNRLAGINLDAYDFKTVLVDPPRSGLDSTTIDLVKRFDNIVYISCNPNTLVENLEDIANTHEITQVALFDQFPFTEHIETGVVLTKR